MLNIPIKNAPKLFDLFFLYETVDDFGIHDLQIWKYVYKHNNSQTCAIRMNRQVCTGRALRVHWVSIRCALGEH